MIPLKLVMIHDMNSYEYANSMSKYYTIHVWYYSVKHDEIELN